MQESSELSEAVPVTRTYCKGGYMRKQETELHSSIKMMEGGGQNKKLEILGPTQGRAASKDYG